MTETEIPTTEQVRQDYAFPWDDDEWGDPRLAAFDRWLESIIHERLAGATREIQKAEDEVTRLQNLLVRESDPVIAGTQIDTLAQRFSDQTTLCFDPGDKAQVMEGLRVVFAELGYRIDEDE